MMRPGCSSLKRRARVVPETCWAWHAGRSEWCNAAAIPHDHVALYRTAFNARDNDGTPTSLRHTTREPAPAIARLG